MYRAALCEDEPVIREWLGHRIRKQFEQGHLPLSLDLFENGDQLLLHLSHTSYDLVFMDIEMPGPDGIEVCRRLRRKNENTLVIFISNKEELVFQSFEVRPFRFIRKSEFESQLPALAAAVEVELRKMAGRLIQVEEPQSGNITRFDVNQITYVEAQGRNCRIVEEDKETLLAVPFQEMVRLLSPHSFIQPHRSYLVSCRYIFRFLKQDIELTDKTLIPLSRRRREEVRQEFLDYMSEV